MSDQEQGKVVTSEEAMAEKIQKAADAQDSGSSQKLAASGAPEGQGVADNPADPESPGYTNTLDTTDT